MSGMVSHYFDVPQKWICVNYGYLCAGQNLSWKTLLSGQRFWDRAKAFSARTSFTAAKDEEERSQEAHLDTLESLIDVPPLINFWEIYPQNCPNFDVKSLFFRVIINFDGRCWKKITSNIHTFNLHHFIPPYVTPLKNFLPLPPPLIPTPRSTRESRVVNLAYIWEQGGGSVILLNFRHTSLNCQRDCLQILCTSFLEPQSSNRQYFSMQFVSRMNKG